MKLERVTILVVTIMVILLGLEFLRRWAFSGEASPKIKKEIAELDSLKDNKKDDNKKGKTNQENEEEKSDKKSDKNETTDSISKSYSNLVFKEAQLKYPRVRTAYKEKGEITQKLYEDKKLDIKSLNIYIRVFKQEKELEIWGKDAQTKSFVLLKKYPICKTSGKLSPKRKSGDEQVPEGFYKIDRFNPQSSFLLSLGLNYPNKSDRILGDTARLGGDIFIHGDCKSIGCMAMTDELIKEIYVMAVDAKTNGQKTIPVSIFPARLGKENWANLKKEYADNPALLKFWENLKKGYDLFEKCNRLPDVTFASNGFYKFASNCK